MRHFRAGQGGVGQGVDLRIGKARTGACRWPSLQAYNDYVAGSGVRSYDIRLGEIFTGDFDRIVFITDDDRGVGAEQDWTDVVLF